MATGTANRSRKRTGPSRSYRFDAAHSLRLTDLPDAVAKKLPRYPFVPATLLGRLAVGIAHQGRKLGQFLLLDALRRGLENTKEIGSAGVVVDALDETASKFYLHHGFILLPGHDRKLFLPMSTINKLFKRSSEGK